VFTGTSCSLPAEGLIVIMDISNHSLTQGIPKALLFVQDKAFVPKPISVKKGNNKFVQDIDF
jgi:hypothetical protein